jgi:hypothetical protein
MKFINLSQRLSPLEHTVEDVRYGIFIGQVEFVDYEKQILAVRDITTGILYERVEVQPASSSSTDHTDTTIPLEGSKCICCNISATNGFIKVAVIQWLLTATKLGLNGISYRDSNNPKGYNLRRRYIYRKGYPGQHVVSLSGGYAELEDLGWDRQGEDLSRDHLDTFRRVRTQTAGTHFQVDESGLQISGEILRPGSDIPTKVLPDGTLIQSLHLKTGDRFADGSAMNIPVVERLERTQEYGLGYPVPQEVLDSAEFLGVLGINEAPFAKTSVANNLDDQSYVNNQAVDAPYDNDEKPLRPFEKDGVSYRRKGFIVESVKGTLVGYNAFDKSTYGQILKPTLFPHTQAGRFSTSLESGYLPVNKSADEVESVLASSAFSLRFPYEYNTTRFDITKEGMVQFEIGSTLPKENIPIDSSTYEHPHGAGRSMEGHFLGSVKLVVGKNRDEEESLDIATLGQVVLRLGSDDTSLPQTRRDVHTQIRSKMDSILGRDLQFWKKPKNDKTGDAGSLENKSAFEKVSLRGAFDGGTILRLGARDPGALRKHLRNGYTDAKGVTESPNDENRKDSRTDGRVTYGSGDSLYAFHDLTQAGKSKYSKSPYFWSDSPITNMDRHGLSLDVHAVRDILLRIGKNPDSGQSLAIDLGGGMVAYLGKDKQSRSITASLDGGAEITIKANTDGHALQLEIDGNVNIYCKGHWHQVVTGDYYVESNNSTAITNIEHIVKATNIRESAGVQHVTEAIDIVNNQGLYKS